MKTQIETVFPLPVLIFGLSFILAGRLTAQTFTTLHSFTPSLGEAIPGDLYLSGNTLYGTTYDSGTDGTNGGGSVFRVNTDGSSFTALYYFGSTAFLGYYETNSDGIAPSGVLLSGNTLYGTATEGGTNGVGTVFAVHSDGTGFMLLHNFTVPNPYSGFNTDGSFPFAGLVSLGNALFGTTGGSGSSGGGTIFAINTDGTDFTVLHTFSARIYDSDPTSPAYESSTNSDGANSYASLLLSGNTLYGTASVGGSSGNGTVFAVNADGTGFRTLHSFTALDHATYTINLDGATPYAGLIVSGNTLYGTARDGGNSGNGTVFALKTDGTGFTTLYSFTGPASLGDGAVTNSDGAHPVAGLILSGNTLYGTTPSGGSSGNGTVFAVNIDGTGFTALHDFTALAPYYTNSGGFIFNYNSDGARPYAGLTISGNTLYGTAQLGGTDGFGSVFSISFTPQLTIIPSTTNLILSWPTNIAGFDYTGYTLQSSTNLGSSAVWSTNLPPPVVVNGQNTLTSPIAGRQMFFRLSQ